MEEIVLFGFGGHAKSVTDCIERQGKYRIIGFVEKDDNNSNQTVYRDYRIIGTDSDAQAIFDSGIRNAFITVGSIMDCKVRIRIYQTLKKIGFSFPVIRDPSAIICDDTYLDEGVFVGKNVIINTMSRINRMAILNTGSIIEHECFVGEFSHISIGTKVCGNVRIGNETLLGANSVVIQGIDIGNNVIIGAGTVVNKDIPDNATAYGNPVRIAKQGKNI